MRSPAQGGEVVAMSPDRGGGGRVGSLYWRGEVFSSRRIAKHEKHRKRQKRPDWSFSRQNSVVVMAIETFRQNNAAVLAIPTLWVFLESSIMMGPCSCLAPSCLI